MDHKRHKRERMIARGRERGTRLLQKGRRVSLAMSRVRMGIVLVGILVCAGLYELEWFVTGNWALLGFLLGRRIAGKFKPTTVIQHAHQSDSYRIWLAAWSGLRTQLPTVQQGVTGFAYFPLGEEERQDLPTVLERTKFGPQIEDVIVKGYR